MYTAVRHPDGSLTLELHVPPEALSPAEARDILVRFESTLAGLRKRVGSARGSRRHQPSRPRSLAADAATEGAAAD